MNRIGLVIGVGAMFILAACGSSPGAAGGSASPSAGANAGRGGAAGQLVQINGTTLILSGANGDITVAYTSATTISKTSAATLADVNQGECIVATGTKDASGLLSATSVRLAPMGANGCAAPGSPAGASPRPAPSGQPNASVVSGEVSAVSGTSVTVLTASSGSQTITVPTVASVSVSSAATAAALQVGECLRANGAPNSSGTVQASSLTITPPGPSGTCTTGNGGFGRPPSSSSIPPAGS
jgi:hypothetical protein